MVWFNLGALIVNYTRFFFFFFGGGVLFLAIIERYTPKCPKFPILVIDAPTLHTRGGRLLSARKALS